MHGFYQQSNVQTPIHSQYTLPREYGSVPPIQVEGPLRRYTRSLKYIYAAGAMTILGFLLACSGLMGPKVVHIPNNSWTIMHSPETATAAPRSPAQRSMPFPQIKWPPLQIGNSKSASRSSSKAVLSCLKFKTPANVQSFRKENIMALVIPYRIRNNAPVARKRDVSFQFKDTLGETRDYGPYNAEQWGLILDVKSSWDLGKIPPNQWIDTVTVVAADPEGVDGAAIYLRMQETRRYSTGKKYKTTKAQTLIELPPVSRKEGPPPWLEVPMDE